MYYGPSAPFEYIELIGAGAKMKMGCKLLIFVIIRERSYFQANVFPIDVLLQVHIHNTQTHSAQFVHSVAVYLSRYICAMAVAHLSKQIRAVQRIAKIHTHKYNYILSNMVNNIIINVA